MVRGSLHKAEGAASFFEGLMIKIWRVVPTEECPAGFNYAWIDNGVECLPFYGHSKDDAILKAQAQCDARNRDAIGVEKAQDSKWLIYAAKGGNGEGDYHNGARYEIRREHVVVNRSLDVDVEYTFDEVTTLAQADCDKRNVPPKPEPRTFLGKWIEVPTFEEAEPAGRNHHGVSMVMGCDGRELIPLHNPLPRNHFFVRLAAQPMRAVSDAEIKSAANLVHAFNTMVGFADGVRWRESVK